MDTVKATRLGKVPPILIITLNHQSYNAEKKQQGKDNKAFSCPQDVDMAPYMAEAEGSQDCLFDLFSDGGG